MDNFSCTLPIIEGEVMNNDFNGSVTKLAMYPTIFIKQEGIIGLSQTVSTKSNLDRPILMTPQNEPLAKRLARICFEEGPIEALSEAEAKTRGQNINHVFRGLNYFLAKVKQFNHLLWPYTDNHDLKNLSEFSQTRDWHNSVIRVMRWHPNIFKLAIASNDDSIRIYSTDSSGSMTLKNGYQKCVTSLAWRPLCPSEIAVGCNTGIIVWKMDFPSRHNSQFIHLSNGNHRPISSLEYNRNGSLLASVSINDANAIIWEVDSQRFVPLKRIGMPCALVKWSPNSQCLFTSTVGSVFRVWKTDKWNPERWIIPTGAIQSAAWSPCSNHLLFVTTDQPILYSLCFIEEQLYKTTAAPKQSFPIADFKPIQSGQRIIGGLPKTIIWDPAGKFVAVMFKSTSSIAVFSTSINRNLLSISPNFYITGDDPDEYPSYICFKALYEKHEDTVLTIAWSTGRVQYFPIH